MSFCLSSISRKSVYLAAFGRWTSFRRSASAICASIRWRSIGVLAESRRSFICWMLVSSLLEPLARVVPVGIAQRDDVLARQVDEVCATHAADADTGNIQEVARRRRAGPGDDVPWHDGEPRGGRGLLQERAPAGTRATRDRTSSASQTSVNSARESWGQTLLSCSHVCNASDPALDPVYDRVSAYRYCNAPQARRSRSHLR